MARSRDVKKRKRGDEGGDEATDGKRSRHEDGAINDASRVGGGAQAEDGPCENDNEEKMRGRAGGLNERAQGEEKTNIDGHTDT